MPKLFKFLSACSLGMLITGITFAAELDGAKKTHDGDGKVVKSQERIKDGKVDGKIDQNKDGANGKNIQNKAPAENKIQPNKGSAQNTTKNKQTQNHNQKQDGKDNHNGDHGGGHHGNNKYEFNHNHNININIAGHPGSDHGHWNQSHHGRYYHGYWHGYWVDRHWVWWRGHYGFWIPFGGVTIFVYEEKPGVCKYWNGSHWVYWYNPPHTPYHCPY